MSFVIINCITILNLDKAQKNEQFISFSFYLQYFVGQVLPQNICAREYVNTKHLGQLPTGK